MLKELSGYKTYIMVVIGAVIVALNAVGVEIPGIKINSADWLANFWQLGLVATARAAVAKIR